MSRRKSAVLVDNIRRVWSYLEIMVREVISKNMIFEL